MKSIKYLVVSAVSLISVSAMAYMNDPLQTNCYLFNGNSVKQAKQCMVESGGGMGGATTEVSMGNSYYEIEENYSGGRESYTLNGKKAQQYYRNYARKITTNTDQAKYYCFRTNDRKIDLCWGLPN